jgi:hypothetical protein
MNTGIINQNLQNTTHPTPHNSSLIEEVIDYQYYRGEHPMSFVEYYFKVHHPIYNEYYAKDIVIYCTTNNFSLKLLSSRAK